MIAPPDLYGYAPFRADRPRIEWPGGARVALWVAPNIEHYELCPPLNSSRAPWLRPQRLHAADLLTTRPHRLHLERG